MRLKDVPEDPERPILQLELTKADAQCLYDFLVDKSLPSGMPKHLFTALFDRGFRESGQAAPAVGQPSAPLSPHDGGPMGVRP